MPSPPLWEIARWNRPLAQRRDEQAVHVRAAGGLAEDRHVPRDRRRTPRASRAPTRARGSGRACPSCPTPLARRVRRRARAGGTSRTARAGSSWSPPRRRARGELAAVVAARVTDGVSAAVEPDHDRQLARLRLPAAAPLGAYTLRYRQSSLPITVPGFASGVSPSSPASCGHAEPKRSASRTPVHSPAAAARASAARPRAAPRTESRATPAPSRSSRRSRRARRTRSRASSSGPRRAAPARARDCASSREQARSTRRRPRR